MSDNNNSREKVYRLVEIKGLNLKNAKDRLFTFHALWSEENEFKDTRSLAAQGFYCSGHFDMTCVSCGVQLCGWKRGDDPKRKHMQSSPQCRFMNGEDTGDIPLPPRNDYLQRSLYQANRNMEERTVKPRPSGNRATGDHDDDKAFSNESASAICSRGIEVSSNLRRDGEQSNFVSSTQLSNYTGENMPVATSSRATEERSETMQGVAASNLEPANDTVIEPNSSATTSTEERDPSDTLPQIPHQIGNHLDAPNSMERNLSQISNPQTQTQNVNNGAFGKTTNNTFSRLTTDPVLNNTLAFPNVNQDDDGRNRTASDSERNALPPEVVLPVSVGYTPFEPWQLALISVLVRAFGITEPLESARFSELCLLVRAVNTTGNAEIEEIIQDATRTYRERIQQLERNQLCSVCFTERKKILLQPCCHYCLCEACSSMCTKCPVCREKILSRLVVFEP